VLVAIVAAACSTPPSSIESVDLMPSCTDDCDEGQLEILYLSLDVDDVLTSPLHVGVDLENVPTTSDRLTFPAETVQHVDLTFEAHDRPTEVEFVCKLPGGTMHVVVKNSDTKRLLADQTFEIKCKPNGLPIIDVVGPNGIIPSMGNDGVGTQPINVQILREYTVRNRGLRDLAITGATAFNVQDGCTGVVIASPPATIAPGENASMTVGVTPTAVGMFECGWYIPNDDPGMNQNPYEVSVTGNVAAAPVPDIDITAASTGHITDGSPQAVGTKPAGVAFSESYRIDNTGLGALTVGTVTIGTLVNCTVTITTAPLTTPLAPQSVGATSLVLGITPIGPGAFMCPVSVPSDDPDAENPYTWTISGIAVAPEIDVVGFADGTPDPVGVKRAGVPFSRSYTINNTGTANLAISMVTIGQQLNCTLSVTMAPMTSVAPAGTTMVTVQATPGDGAFACPFAILNNDADEASYDLGITGTGVKPEIDVFGPGGMISSGGMDDAGTKLAGASFSRAYSILNTGSGPLAITPPVSIGTLTNCMLSVSMQPGANVASGGSTMMVVSVTPTAQGAFSCAFSIANDDADEASYVVTVTGVATEAKIVITGEYGGVFQQSGTNMIPSVSVGATTTVSWIVRNNGDAVLSVSAMLDVTSTVNCVVTVTRQIPATLDPAVQDFMSLAINPQTAGPFSFDLIFDSNDADNPHIVLHVVGTGVAPPDIEILGFPSGSTDDVGSVAPGSPVTRTYTVQNLGTGPLNIGIRSSVSSNCTVGTWTGPVGPISNGGTSMMSVTVTPDAAGAFSCTLHIRSNDPDISENPYTVVIAGSAAASIGNFGSMLGNYFGDNNCGIQGWSLKNVGGLQVDSFGSNPDGTFFFVGGDPNVATASGLIIFGAPGHTCTLTRISNFTVNIDCTNASGGSCHEIASKN
jgi:hypothetical protein